MDMEMEFNIWKEEPLSPVYLGLESEESDVWQLFEDDVAKEAEAISQKEEQQEQEHLKLWLPDSPGDSCDSCDSFLTVEHIKLQNNSHAVLASPLFEDFDDVLIKQEPFADWLEQKVDLFDDLSSSSSSTKEDVRVFGAPVPAPAPAPAPFLSFASFPPPPAAVQVPLQLALQTQPLPLPQAHIVPLSVPADTQTLLQEFECVFGKVEQSHGALTPPQSPPPLPLPQPQQTQTLTSLLPPNEDFSALTPNPVLIAEVDEIVRSRVAESWSDPNAFRPLSPCTSSNSSFSEDAEPEADPSSESDPEWSPESPPAAAPSKPRGRKRGANRSRPYNTEDKRLRKKEQNKNAATRYRMKKKAEVEEIVGEANELKEKRDQLQAKVTDLSQEIRYLKNLMREVFRAKGLIK